MLSAGVEDRTCVLRSLELFCRLMGIEENAQLLARHSPPELVERLHELMYVPLQGMDSLTRPEDPVVTHQQLR